MGLQGRDGSDVRFSRYVEGLASVIGHADRVNPLRDYCTAYGQIICPTDAPSRRLPMIVAQEPTQSLATLHRPLAAAVRVPRKQQDVALALVVPFGVEMIDIVAQRLPQGALAEQDHELWSKVGDGVDQAGGISWG